MPTLRLFLREEDTFALYFIVPRLCCPGNCYSDTGCVEKGRGARVACV